MARKSPRNGSVAEPVPTGFPTFTAAIDHAAVRWLTTVFDRHFSDTVRVEVQRDAMAFGGSMDNNEYTPPTGSIRVVFLRDNPALQSLRTRVAGGFDIDTFRFGELANLASVRRYPYRFRMDGDGVLFAGSGALTRSFGHGGVVRSPPEDFLLTSADLNLMGSVPDTPTMETTW